MVIETSHQIPSRSQETAVNSAGNYWRKGETQVITMPLKKEHHRTENFRLQKIFNRGSYDIKNDKKISAKPVNPVVFSPFRGLLYMCFHSVFAQIPSVIVKKLFYISPCQFSFIRNAGIFVGALPISVYTTRQILGEKKYRPQLLLRSLFGATGCYLQIIAYRLLPLAEASVVLSSIPIVTTLMERLLLKEHFGLTHSVGLVMTVCGVLLALRLPILIHNRDNVVFNSIYVSGLAAAVGCVLFISISFVYARKLKEVHFSVIILYLSVIGMIENAVISGIFVPVVPPYCGWDQMLCLSVGVFCFIANSFMTLAIQVEPAGLATVQRSSLDILTIIVYQILFFYIYPDAYVIAGACLVIAAMSIIGMKNWIVMLPEESKMRYYFKFLL